MTKYEPVTEFSAERCEILAQLIEQQPHTWAMAASGFNMSSVQHLCGTPCCIIGFCGSLLGSEHNSAHPAKAAENFLGCSVNEALSLFFGGFRTVRDQDLSEITPQEAAAAIRSLAKKRKEQSQ